MKDIFGVLSYQCSALAKYFWLCWQVARTNLIWYGLKKWFGTATLPSGRGMVDNDEAVDDFLLRRL